MMSKELTGQLIIFSLAENLFGMDVTSVQEILPAIAVRSIPKSSPHLRGLIDFRGQIIPVLNLRSLLQLSQDQTVRSIIVMQHSGRNYGLLVDGVKEVLSAEQTMGKELMGTDIAYRDYSPGSIAVQDRQVVVLSLAAIVESLQSKEGLVNAGTDGSIA